MPKITPFDTIENLLRKKEERQYCRGWLRRGSEFWPTVRAATALYDPYVSRNAWPTRGYWLKPDAFLIAHGTMQDGDPSSDQCLFRMFELTATKIHVKRLKPWAEHWFDFDSTDYLNLELNAINPETGVITQIDLMNICLRDTPPEARAALGHPPFPPDKIPVAGPTTKQ